MTVRERAALGNLVARKRLSMARTQPRARTRDQWVGSKECPVHHVAVPVKADGSLGGYCFKCLGEAATALESWGHEWRLHGYVRGPERHA